MATNPAASRGGCLKWVIRGFIALVVVAAIAMSAVMYTLGNAEVVTQSIARASKHPGLAARLGTPLKRGWLLSGSVQVNGPSGKAEVGIPVSGPKGGATIYTKAVKSMGKWTIEQMEAAPDDGGPRIDLLKDGG